MIMKCKKLSFCMDFGSGQLTSFIFILTVVMKLDVRRPLSGIFIILIQMNNA
jgi:hypothetical protein